MNREMAADFAVEVAARTLGQRAGVQRGFDQLAARTPEANEQLLNELRHDVNEAILLFRRFQAGESVQGSPEQPLPFSEKLRDVLGTYSQDSPDLAVSRLDFPTVDEMEAESSGTFGSMVSLIMAFREVNQWNFLDRTDLPDWALAGGLATGLVRNYFLIRHPDLKGTVDVASTLQEMLMLMATQGHYTRTCEAIRVLGWYADPEENFASWIVEADKTLPKQFSNH